MAITFQTLIPLLLFFFISLLPFSSSQSQGSPQNIEVFYPTTPIPPPSPPSPPPSTPSTSPPSSNTNNNTNSTIAKAVAATAGSTIVIAAIFFFLIRRYVIAKRKRDRVEDHNNISQPSPRVTPPDDFARVNGNVKGLIVDENGLDVLYWRQLQNGGDNNNNNNNITGFRQEVLHHVPKADEEEQGMVRKGSRTNKIEPVHEIPLLRGKSSTSHILPPPDDDDSSENMSPLTPPPPPPSHGIVLKAVEKKEAPVQSKFAPPAPPSMPPAPLPVQTNKSPPPPPNRGPAPPPPPLPVRAKGPAPPPPPPGTALKPPSAGRDSKGESSGDGDNNNQVKLKPLHWDKVNKNNADHSMVWDKIHGGSFKVDDNLMEALFGYVATNKKSPARDNDSKNTNATSSSSQIMVLDPRKSQNIAIVLKSLALSRRELLDALNEGQGLEADTLEKLMRITPTDEEQSQILDFNGDPTRLADAESFLFHILKALPSAFTRLNAMQFRSNYDLEILHMKESLHTLESGCKELRSQRLFMKLLEAILKAGNRMNAGTTRGNAQAFNLTSLLKLSDVKSTDGKTTLLNFVVEEVVRSEGRKCFISRSHSLSRSSSSRSSNGTSGNSASKEDREKEYVTLGLPVVGGLSAEFTNVKKAATIDFNTFSGTCSALSARVAETKQLVLQCMVDGKGGFVQEMKGFIDDAEDELKVTRDEQKRVMDVVKRTTEYYQAGASKDPFRVFVIVKDFLGMVDRVCIEIARNQQKRKSSIANPGPQSPTSPESRTKMRFPVLPPNFMTDKSRSNSSNSDLDS